MLAIQCSCSVFEKEEKYNIVILTYPARTFTCNTKDLLRTECGYNFNNCIEKDTEEKYNQLLCINNILIQKLDNE